MKIARDLETRLESLRGSTAGQVHPFELAAGITAEAGLGCKELVSGPAAPNRFTIRLNRNDLRAFPNPQAVHQVLEKTLEDAAMDRGWRLPGPARVRLEADPSLPPGSFSVMGWERPGRRPAWAVLTRPGEEHPLSVNRCLVGRSRPSDLILAHSTVSPLHTLIWQENGTVWIQDMDSDNGTFLAQNKITGKVSLPANSLLGFGTVEYQLEVL